MKRLRLINLSSLPIVGNQPIYPLGLVSIADALRAQGHDAEIVDFVAHPQRVEDLAWLDKPCDVIGFAVRDIDPINIARYAFIGAFVDFAQRVRERVGRAGYRPLWVGGGAGFTLFAQPLGSRLGVDVAVVGEGERVLADLCLGHPQAPTHGLALRSSSDDGFVDRQLEHPPALVAAYLASGYSEIGVETRRRKCLRKCQYCPYAFINEGTLGDFKPIPLLRSTIEQLYGLGVRHIFFTDAVFNNEPKAAKRVCRMLGELGYRDLQWSAYFVPSQFDRELAELIAGSGNRVVIMSPDSFDPRMLKASGKSFNLTHVLRAKSLCDDIGLTSAWTLLFGSAHEDRDTIRRSGQIANEHFADDQISINVGIRLLPGSPLVKRLHLSAEELLLPVFYPIDPRVFDWILQDFEPRFFQGAKMLRVQATRASLARLSRRPLVNPIDPHLDFLLTQERQGRLFRGTVAARATSAAVG